MQGPAFRICGEPDRVGRTLTQCSMLSWHSAAIRPLRIPVDGRLHLLTLRGCAATTFVGSFSVRRALPALQGQNLPLPQRAYQ